jgi:hypothetical protein
LRKAWISVAMLYHWSQIALTWMLPSLFYLTIHFTFVVSLPKHRAEVIPASWTLVNNTLDAGVQYLATTYMALFIIQV